MVSVAENDIHHLTDGSCFVEGTINVVHWDGMSKGSGSEPVLLYVVLINEEPIGSAIK